MRNLRACIKKKLHLYFFWNEDLAYDEAQYLWSVLHRHKLVFACLGNIAQFALLSNVCIVSGLTADGIYTVRVLFVLLCS